jgi:hypothetical protein
MPHPMIWLTILVGIVIFSVLALIIAKIMDSLFGNKSSCVGAGVIMLVAGVLTFYICKFMYNNIFGGKQETALVQSYQEILPKIDDALSNSSPNTDTFGILILDRNDNGVLEVRGDEMTRVPAECRAAPNRLPEIVLFFGTRENVIGYCTGACPGGSELTETHYWHRVDNLSTGTEYGNTDAASGDVKKILQEYCPQYK